MSVRVTTAVTVWVIAALVTCAGVQSAQADVRRINAPHLADPVPFPEAAIAWFGRVDATHNYTDVRVAYTNTELWVSLSIFDQWVWEDDAASRTPASLEQWDAVTMLIDRGSVTGAAPAATSYRFVGELNWWRPRTDYQAAY